MSALKDSMNTFSLPDVHGMGWPTGEQTLQTWSYQGSSSFARIAWPGVSISWLILTWQFLFLHLY